MNASTALERLINGNRRFAAGTPTGPNRSLERLRETAQRQQPFAAVLTCSDSRVVPTILFDWGIGDLFVVRTAGNVLDDVALASLEFAVDHCGVPLVLVLGHTGCGAVRAALDGTGQDGVLACLHAALAPSVEVGRRFPGDEWRSTVMAHVEKTMAALRARAPEIARRAADGRVVVLAGCYDLETGLVEFLAAENDGFGRRVLDQVSAVGVGGGEPSSSRA